ncbi:hypothetical protein [Microvirga sp. KLBC 81]|uniref:hypothetical protein n=1 Tax=Microvirga sp. KLBC 81 TaxID=1862707 RepID=UPI001057FB1C|nr:hypothetical protein [Microvirga sp. KLBC 81]
MTSVISAAEMNDKLSTIERVLSGIERGGGAIHLRDLTALLVETISMLERDPGLEVAADDLYAAAERFVRDSHVGSQPPARKQRLLTEAHMRFHRRLKGNVERCELDDQRGCRESITLRAA